MLLQRQSSVLVASRLQWEAIDSAVRIELWETLRSNGPCSIRELAEQMDRPADGLYQHMRKLERAGLIVETEQRPAGTQREAVYDVTADDIDFDIDERTGRNITRLARIFATVIRCAGRSIEAAFASRQVKLSKPGKDILVRWDVGWLSDADVAAVKRHQQEILAILERGRTRRTGRLYAVMSYLVPQIRGRSSAAGAE